MKQTTPATAPIAIEPAGKTKPAAGVIATRPATAPEMMPSTDGLPRVIHSANIQPSAAAAVAICVTAIAIPRSEEHTSELQSLMRISYAVFCLTKKIKTETEIQPKTHIPHKYDLMIRHNTLKTRVLSMINGVFKSN